MLSLARAAAVACLLVMATAARAAAGTPASSAVYYYDLTFSDGSSPFVQVAWWAMAADGSTARAPAGKSALLRLCLQMEGTARFIDKPIAGMPDVQRRMRRSADDADCLEAELPPGAPLRVSYTLRLGAMADSLSDFDSATAVPGGLVFSDKALLLRPEPTPDEGKVIIAVTLPAGTAIASPWDSERAAAIAGGLAGAAPAARVYTLSIDGLDGGGYVALGKGHALAPIALRGGAVEPWVFDVPRHNTDEELGLWVRSASAMLSDFYGGLPNRRILALLVGIPRNGDGSVFGTVMKRSPTPSVVLLYGADSKGAAFEDDWMAPHEIFHVGNPAIEGRFAWFIEGFTTYYQDVIRARARPARAAAMWADLVYEFRKHCDGKRSLAEDSRRMRELHNWTRVYWGGACLAFQADVAIRKRTRNKESLDTVMRAMLAESRADALDEEGVITRLDRAAGRPLVRERLQSKSKAPLAEIYQQLGIEPSGDTVKLHDDAPLAHIRKAIF